MADNDTNVTSEKLIQKLSQAEAAYVTTPNGAMSCASCRWFNSESDWYKCNLVVDNSPYPIVASGYCERHEPYPVMDDHHQPTGESLDPSEPIALPSMDMGMRGILRNLKQRYGWKWLDYLLPSDFPDNLESGGFKVLSDGRWLAWWTNNFKDLESEIISENAISEFIKAANDGNAAMPELWWMHTPGTKHGVTEKLFQLGHFAVAVGRFDDESVNPLVKIFKSWYKNQKRITVSHGFMYRSDKFIDGVYHHIRTYEISSLKAGREANPFTKFEYQIEAKLMALVTDMQRAEVEKEFGKDIADYVVNLANTQGKLLEESGVAFKAKKPPFGSDDEDEGMDENGKPKKPKKSISDGELLVMASMKQMQDEHLKVMQNYAGQVDATRQEAKDINNRLSQVETALGDVNDKMRRMSEYFGTLTGLQPRASKSPRTEVPTGDIQTDYIQKQMEDSKKANTPIFNQMKSMDYGGGEVVTPNFNPNGHSE